MSVSTAPTPRKILPLFLPSREGQSTINTLICLTYLCLKQNKSPGWFSADGQGQAVNLNVMIENARKALKAEGISGVVRGFWIEDDILFSQDYNVIIPQLEEIMTTADANGWNVVAPYTLASTQCSYYHFPKIEGEEAYPYTLEETRALKPFDPVDLGGLGFYYGDVDLDYIWHEGKPNSWSRFSGIDWNYWEDKNIKLRHYPLNLLHVRRVRLESPLA